MAANPLRVLCRIRGFIHKRNAMHVPIGQEAMGVLLDVANNEFGKMNFMGFVGLGAQPLVLRQVPPLVDLLLNGCGCKKCAKYKVTAEAFSHGWASAYDVISFYMLVLETNAMLLTPSGQTGTMNAIALDNMMKLFRTINMRVMSAQSILGIVADKVEIDQEMATLWKELDKTLRLDDAPVLQEGEEPDTTAALARDGIPMPLTRLAVLLSSYPNTDYTLGMIQSLELQIWNIICEVGPKEGRAERRDSPAVVTTDEMIACLGQFPDADEHIRTQIVPQQENYVRLICTGSENGSAMMRWPKIKLPPRELVEALSAACPPNSYGQTSSFQSGVYTVFALYYCALSRCIPPTVEAAKPSVEEAAREQ